jgi:CO/xanthine dehydrogenase Mo-binding subunit
MLTGRPVRCLHNREEEMQFGPPRGAERIFIKDGVMKDGRIIARYVRSYFDSGAYTRLSSYAVVKCVAHIPGPYTIPNVWADVYCVYTNRTPATAMRGFGITAVDSALETQMDKLAHLVGMNPMEFRILNAYRDGDMKAHRREAKNCALIECVQVAAEKAKWPIRDEFKRMHSRSRGGGDRAVIPHTPGVTPSATPPRPQRTSYERPGMPQPTPQSAPQPMPAAASAPQPPSLPAQPAPVQTQHGATRFSSVFGTRRR